MKFISYIYTFFYIVFVHYFWKFDLNLANMRRRKDIIRRVWWLCSTAVTMTWRKSNVTSISQLFIPPPYPHVEMITISALEVKDVLRNLSVTKSSGPDLISPRLLKEVATELCGPLSEFFNRLIQEGTFPLDYKKSNIVPVDKKGDRSIPTNYRPISLLSTIGKSMERCIHKHVYNYCIANNTITPFQSGFVRGDSTTYQLFDIYNSFCVAVDRQKGMRWFSRY